VKGTMQQTTCLGCSVLNCFRHEGKFPQFCLTEKLDRGELAEVIDLYRSGSSDSKVALAAAEIEGKYYGKLTRVEEIVAFAKALGAKKIGIAACVGLSAEARTFARILDAKGLQGYGVICKVGSVDKSEIAIPEDLKVQPGSHEALCNPIMQARLLNRQKTDLNVIIGLCVGHDSLFIKYSKALVTTLITKDRVLGHNPAAALYTSGFYYKRLLGKDGSN
jgi:uncharacterized metal-binding protein